MNLNQSLNLPLPQDFLQSQGLKRDAISNRQSIKNKERVLYYPGAGIDWEPIRTFAPNSNIKTFVYVDYMLTLENVISGIERLTDWKILNIENLEPKFFGLKSWRQFWAEDFQIKGFQCNKASYKHSFDLAKPFACRIRLEIQPSLEIDLYYLHTDGIETFRILGQRNWNLQVMVVQFHGMGGNWNGFDSGSALEHYNQNGNPVPYIYFSDNAKVYSGYKQVTLYDDTNRESWFKALYELNST